MFQIADPHLLLATAKFYPDGRPVDFTREHWKSLPTNAKSSAFFRFRRVLKETLNNII